MSDLIRRRRAIAATRKAYEGRAHRFGTVDCVKVGARHVRHMGHKRALGMGKAGSYRSAKGAMVALRRAGFARVADALDRAGFPRIAPAAALPGDLLVAPGSHGLDAVMIVIDGHVAMGFHEDDLGAGLLMINLTDLTDIEAWRL
jgi:hypothetical protein